MGKNITLECLKFHFAMFIENNIVWITSANLSNYKIVSENLLVV